jgi:hypothetical protein
LQPITILSSKAHAHVTKSQKVRKMIQNPKWRVRAQILLYIEGDIELTYKTSRIHPLVTQMCPRF